MHGQRNLKKKTTQFFVENERFQKRNFTRVGSWVYNLSHANCILFFETISTCIYIKLLYSVLPVREEAFSVVTGVGDWTGKCCGIRH